MTGDDDSILEFFERQDEGLTLPPAVVHHNLVEVHEATDKSKETIARRMRQLTKRGLLEKTDESKGYYQLTDKGRAYLAGELDAEDLKLEDENE